MTTTEHDCWYVSQYTIGPTHCHKNMIKWPIKSVDVNMFLEGWEALMDCELELNSFLLFLCAQAPLINVQPIRNA